MQLEIRSVSIAESTSKLNAMAQPVEEEMIVQARDDLVDLDQGEDEEFCFEDDGSQLDEETRLFDKLVGLLEEVMMDPEFHSAKEAFCNSSCAVFDDDEEQKLEYMTLFNQYTQLIEQHIESKLQESMPDVNMADLLSQLEQHKDELMAEVFDELVAMADFDAFKEMMLAYKADASGRNDGLRVSVTALKVHHDEQEEGEERPDLDMGLHVTRASNKCSSHGAGASDMMQDD